jgi:hypothetical protein
MANIGVINLRMAWWWRNMVKVVRGAAKNKPKTSVAEISSSTLAKRRCGHPLGRKNKVKTSTTPTNISEYLDVSLA